MYPIPKKEKKRKKKKPTLKVTMCLLLVLQLDLIKNHHLSYLAKFPFIIKLIAIFMYIKYCQHLSGR